MGSDFSEETATDAVVTSFAKADDPRLREVLESLVRHLHGFVRDVEPTQAEWETAIGFLTEVGQMCDDRRQEFILLSDVLGVSILVDAINHRRPAGATESTVLGPFHIEGAEPDGFRDPESGGVTRRQDGAVLGGRDAIKRANDFAGTEHDREPSRFLRRGNQIVERPGSLEGDLIEEPERADRDLERTGRQVSLPNQVDLIGANLLRAQDRR